MAGISISKSESWIVSKWTLRYLLENIRSKIPEKTRLAEEFRNALDFGYFWINLDEIKLNEVILFNKEVINLLKQIEEKGSNCFKTPEAFEGFITNIKELLTLIENELHKKKLKESTE